MKKLIIIATLTLFVLCEARPGVVTPKPAEIERSVEAEEKHVRVRRNFDYGDYMSRFWNKVGRCTNCNELNVGNGYKNRNEVYMGQRHKSRKHNVYKQMLNIGNGYKNRNTVFFGAGQNSPSQDMVNIGNGAKNTNTVYFGVKPGSVNGDPFKGSFWED